MINLPFHKWKLQFYSDEFESAYEEHLNKIRQLSFKIINLFIFFAALLGLITFIVQQQPLLILIIMGLVVLGCLQFQLMSKKLQPYLKQVFSLYYAITLAGHIIIASNGIDIPLFIFGFNYCCQAIVMMQYSDNRLKVIYTIITPIVLLIVFNIFQILTLHYVFQTTTCALLIGVWTYMNEYTSRLAFSLNLIANQQKNLINEFVSDGMVAISLKDISRQFQIEFHNRKYEEISKLEFGQQILSSKHIDLENNDNLKQFLRNSFVINSVNQSNTKLLEKNLQKFIKLEDFCFAKIKEEGIFIDSDIQEQIEIGYQTKDEIKVLQLLIKKLNFGKPLLLLVIKTIEAPKQIKQYELIINDYQRLITQNSEKQVSKLLQYHQELKNSSATQLLRQNQKLQCLNLQIINYLRNFIVFFNKNQIMKSKIELENIQLINYINTLGNYFQQISNFNHLKFEMVCLFQRNLIVNINSKLLTQLSINIFDDILQYSHSIQRMIFKVEENINTNFDIIKDMCILQESKKVETQGLSKQIGDQRLIIFTFEFESQTEISFIDLEQIQDKNNRVSKNLDLKDNVIVSQVNSLLLSKLGPYDNIVINQNYLREKNVFQNSLQFQFYADQSLIEPSYYKVMGSSN